MNLPPLPETHLNNKAEKFYTAADMKTYGESCIAAYKAIVTKRNTHRKFSDADVDQVRELHAQGFNYKAVNRQIEMSEVTFTNIIKHKGAYK